MKKTLIDIVPVMVGILLALFISNWQQVQSEKSYINNSIQAIILENESNIEELSNSLNRQRAFLDTLKEYSTTENSLYDIVKIARGLNTPDLKSTTWKFLIQDSKHTLVDYEFINRLAEIEKFEKLINVHNQKILDIFYQPAFFNDPDLKRVCNLMLQDQMSIEMAMRESLQDFNTFARKTNY